MTPGDTHPDLVSTILPVHDRPLLLREAAASVLAQSWPACELIIVDDGSRDETPEVARELARARPGVVRVLHQARAGPAAAREAGRRLARGGFVQYLDSDDLLAPDKLARQVTVLRERPECAIAYAPTAEYQRGEPPGSALAFRTGQAFDSLFPQLLEGRLWRTVTPLFRRELTDRIGPWSAELRLLEDLEYDARAGALGARLAWCDGVLAHHRHHPGPRAGRVDWSDPEAVGSWGEALARVYGCALRAGVAAGHPALRRFGRSLFLAARRCGGVGLSPLATRLLGLAAEAGGPSAQLRLYAGLARLLGWRLAGRLSAGFDDLRGRSGGLRGAAGLG